MSLVLGLDVSTTATKAVLVDRSGVVVAIGVAEYDYQTPAELWTEQDPGLWWQATIDAVSQAIETSGMPASAIEAIGLTGQMHGSVLLDDRGDVVRPAILWNDQRTQSECDEIRERVGAQRLIEITGNDALTGFTAPKLLWVRNHEPHNWARVAHVLLPKDYVRYRLTDSYAVDVAGGSGTILFDLAARTWSPEILEALDLDPDLFPETFEGPATTAPVSAGAAAQLGVEPGIPVAGGGGDQSANAVGVGAVSPGVVALSLGTSGVVFATTDGPQIESEGRVHSFCHAVPGRWHMMGVMLSAAGSLRWWRDAVSPETPFDEFVAGAEQLPPGSDGLFFLPYLTGERTPHPDPYARGGFVGLTVRHRRDHMTRSVMEGVVFGLRDGLDLMVAAGLEPPTQIRASGGGLRSPLWRQILADVLDAEIATVNTSEGAAYGAGLLAAVATGWFETVEEACESTITATPAAEPGKDTETYRELHDLYRGLYPALAPTFHAASGEDG